MSVPVAEVDPFVALAMPLQEPTRKLAAVLARSSDTCATLVPPDPKVHAPYYLGSITGVEIYDYEADADPLPPGTLESASVRPANVGGQPRIVEGEHTLLVEYSAYVPMANVFMQGVAPEHTVRDFLDVVTGVDPMERRDAFRMLTMTAIVGCAGPDERHAMENPHYSSPLSLPDIRAAVEAIWTEIPEESQFVLATQ